MNASPAVPRTSTFAVVVLALLFACGCSAALAQPAAVDCTPAATTPSAPPGAAGQSDAPVAAPDRGFLWRISRDGRASWLYGTIHVGLPAWAVPGPQVDAAFLASDTLALEIDLLDPEMQTRTVHAFMKPTDTPFPSVASVPYEVRDRLAPLLVAACIPVEIFDVLPPQLALAGLAGLAARQDGFTATEGIDLALGKRARNAGRTVVSLETPELQGGALQLPNDAPAAIAYVSEALDALADGSARTALLRIATVWAEGDWPALSSYADWCDCLKTAADRTDMKRLLDDRNPGLADGIVALHASGKRVFAAVGSLHMIGPLGLPAQLARRGFKVERVSGVGAPAR